MSMVSVYYYLQVVKVMFIADAQEDTPITNPLGTQIALALSFLGILVIGIYPTALFNWGLSAAHSFLGIL
jgi:NADH-quinone oxidoreductase subunit N